MPKFLHFLRTYIFIFTILFHHSLDNDRSTVETSYSTVSFYRQKTETNVENFNFKVWLIETDFLV